MNWYMDRVESDEEEQGEKAPGERGDGAEDGPKRRYNKYADEVLGLTQNRKLRDGDERERVEGNEEMMEPIAKWTRRLK